MMLLQGLMGRKEQAQLGPAHPIPALCPDLQEVSCLVLHCTEIRPTDLLSSCPPFLPVSSLGNSRKQSLIFYFDFIYLFLAALGLGCCGWAFSSCSKWGLLFIAVHGLLISVPSLDLELGL